MPSRRSGGRLTAGGGQLYRESRPRPGKLLSPAPISEAARKHIQRARAVQNVPETWITILPMPTAQEITLAEAATHIAKTSRRHKRPFFFMVGAGVSYPPVPLASQIVDACRKETGPCEAPQSLDAMAEYSWWFQRAFHSPADRQCYLRSLIENQFVSQANLRLAHLLLSKTLTNLLITTNFDDFVSRSLTIFNEPHVICDHPETIQRIDPESDDLQIVHVHGTYWFYDCCNLAGEVKARSGRSGRDAFSMADFLDHVFTNRAPLVLGYSGWEGDVFMSALKRRLRRGLPYNLYWFCYQRSAIQNLPRDLTDHPNVFFVVPEPGRSETDFRRAARRQDPRTSQAAVSERTGSAFLAASEVLDALVAMLALEAPPLTRDPLGFFAQHLRRSLPPDESGRVRPDPYLIRRVIKRIERASLNLTAVEQRLEAVRDAVRRSQYREAIEKSSTIVDTQIDEDEIRELMETVLLAASRLSENSPEELAAYERVAASGRALIAQRLDDSRTRECVAKALVNKANVLGAMARIDEALQAYDEVWVSCGSWTEPGVAYQLARALYNKAVTCAEAKDFAGSLEAYAALDDRFGKAESRDVRGLVAWAQYNRALAYRELGQLEEGERVLHSIVSRFDADEHQDCSEVVVLALTAVADNAVGKAKGCLLAGDDQGAKAHLERAGEYLFGAAERNPENPYVLGTQAYLQFLLGDKTSARGLLARAVELGGEELRAAELEAVRCCELPADKEFVQILDALPAGSVNSPRR